MKMKMSGKGRANNNNTESKIVFTGDSLPKLHNNHTPIRKSHSASVTKPVHSRATLNNRPATASSLSFPSTSQIAKCERIENTKGLQDEVNRALEKYRRSAMCLPQAETVSECIETQLAALRDRLQVNQLLLKSTRKQMENIMFEEGTVNSGKDPQNSVLEVGAAKLSSGIGQYQKTMNEAMNVLDKVQKMNEFHDSSKLKRKVHWKKEEKILK